MKLNFFRGATPLLLALSANSAMALTTATPPLDLTNVAFRVGTQALDSSLFSYSFDPARQGWTATLSADQIFGTEGGIGATEDDYFMLKAGSWFYWKTDPEISYDLFVQDRGAPSNFFFSTNAPIDPVVSGPHSLESSFGGAITDGGTNGVGISVGTHTAPLDADGVPELQVVTFKKNNTGNTLLNAGQDLGVGESFGTGAHDLNGGNAYNQFDLKNIGGLSAWNYWQIDIAFRGTGGNDVYDLAGASVLTAVPIPAAFWLFGAALASTGMAKRRSRG